MHPLKILIFSCNSWEIGTRAEALLELDTPNASVFNNTNSIPAPASAGITSAYLTPVISIAKSTVQARKAGGALVSDDTSVADPASIGVAVLLANLTVGSDTTTNYAQAASDQLNYLLHTAPRAPDGAISHRTDSVQLWSDFIYMVPPFLAYYGAVTANQSLLEEAYNQIKLYRGHLKDDSGLWKHIATGDGSPNGADPSHWSTGGYTFPLS